MATFAQLSSNTVTNIVKVRNVDIDTRGDQTEEQAGIVYLQNILPGTTWKQVFWGSLPSVGFTYDPATNKFTDPTPEVEVEEETKATE